MELRSVTLTWEIFGFSPHHYRAVVPCAGCGGAFCLIRKSATSNVTEAIADYRYSNLCTEIPDFDDFTLFMCEFVSVSISPFVTV